MKYFFFIIIITFLFSCKNKKEWSYKTALPETAVEVKEWYWQEGFLPDYEYYLKAKMSKQDFLKYIDTLKLVPYSDTLKFEDDILWSGLSGLFRDNVKDWWLTDENKDSSYVWNKGQEWNTAKYVNGCLYFYAYNH